MNESLISYCQLGILILFIHYSTGNQVVDSDPRECLIYNNKGFGFVLVRLQIATGKH